MAKKTKSTPNGKAKGKPNMKPRLIKKGKQGKKDIAKVLGSGPLRQPTLGGMPRVRNARLDKLAEAVGESRDAINDATRDIKGFRAAALKEMIEKNLSFWSHGGVDFIVTPGEPELKIKTHKGGSGETGAGAPDDALDAEAAEAQEEVYADDAPGLEDLVE